MAVSAPGRSRAAPNATPPGAARFALAGVLAAAVALAVTELLAALLPAAGSLLVEVGDVVIDYVPGPVERAVIDIFGTADKALLVASMLVVALAAGALLGVAAARRRGVAAVGFGAFALLGVLAAARDPQVSALQAAVAAVVAAVAGLALLDRLLAAAGAPAAPARPSTGAAEHGVVEDGTAEDGGRARSGAGAGANRRRFLVLSGVAAVAAVAAAATGRWLAGRSRVVQARAELDLPAPAVALPDVPAGASLPVDGITPLFTPNEDFYRIDTALTVPRVDPSTWALAVTGMVDRPYELTFDELSALPQVEADVTLACVSNEVGGDLIDNARWRGVRLDSVLRRAGIQPGATQVVGRSVDGFTAGFPTADALDGRDALIAIGMNGDPLPLEHGFPARLVVPGLYGYVSATKWLVELELTTLEGFDAYWIPRGWAKEAPIKTQSRIDVPRARATVPAGRTAVAGVAWAQQRGIQAVDVRVDEGPWHPARLAEAVNVDTWRQWVWEWQAEAGEHLLEVRATDGTGRPQTAERSSPVPDGATGYHSVRVTVG